MEHNTAALTSVRVDCFTMSRKMHDGRAIIRNQFDHSVRADAEFGLYLNFVLDLIFFELFINMRMFTPEVQGIFGRICSEEKNYLPVKLV